MKRLTLAALVLAAGAAVAAPKADIAKGKEVATTIVRHVMRRTATAASPCIPSSPRNTVPISTVKPWILKKANVQTVPPL